MSRTEKSIDARNEFLWQARFDDSVSMSRNAVKVLARAEKVSYQKGMAYAKLNISAANFYQSKNDIALKYLTETISWFNNNTGEKGFVRALLLKGNIHESFGDYEKTLSLWLEAYEVAREYNEIESEGESCSQLGLIYLRLCNYQKSLEFFNKGLQIREKLEDENGVASSLNRIGMVLRQTKKYEESLEFYFRSLEIRKKNKQLSAIPWTLLGLANTYEEMKMYSESLDYYEQGMKGGDKRCTLQCMMGAGRVHSRTGETEKAEKRLKESLRMALELKSLGLVAEAHSSLALHYEYLGQPATALKSFKQFLKVKESYQSLETRSKLSNIEVAHAIEKSEQEKEIYRLRHVELKEAYDIIEENNKEITASINYASSIQRAILPNPKEIRGLTDNLLIFYLPKEVVSGDFYWFRKAGQKFIIAAGDCTGHGVPGALMSMLGISFLEEIVNKRRITEPGQVLNELRREIQSALHQKGLREEAKDGMDISLCVLDHREKIIQYSGANNNLYLIRNNELIEYQADRMPIGIYDLLYKDFTTHRLSFISEDLIYMFSDGFPDQQGGPDCKKFKHTGVKALLLKIHKLPMNMQKQKLEKEFHAWKGNCPQRDDVLVLGLKL